jgi:GNAT superfamily N-acetyltransferase
VTKLEDGLYDLPPAKVAMIVTHLEMRAPAQTRDRPLPDGVSLRPVEADVNWYRDIFRKVGADWLWYGRLLLSDAELESIVTHNEVEIFTLTRDNEDLALLELDFRTEGQCELAYFGLAAPLIGTGAGRALMNTAIDRAWSRPIERFHVHTCTIDSPQALDFYLRSGFEITRQQVEVADDPRVIGLLPTDKGAHVPLIRG